MSCIFNYKDWAKHGSNYLSFLLHEDTAVAIEKNIINSKRLIIILTPGTSFGMKSENAYDQQLGLYNALVHDEMKVILIEMENFSSYKDLPESLQHIIQKRKTLKWNGGQSPNSRFWKHLRYEMPSKRNPTYFTVQNVSTPTPEFGTYIEWRFMQSDFKVSVGGWGTDGQTIITKGVQILIFSK